MPANADPIAEFAARLGEALAQRRFVRAVFAKYRGAQPDLERIDLRVVPVRGEPQLQFVYHHATRDVTRNHPFEQVADVVPGLLGRDGFRHAQLHTVDALDELAVTQRGQAHLRRVARSTGAPEGAAATHNREKWRALPIERPFLSELGVTTADHRLVPAMARKWKQINKFVEIVAAAIADSPLPRSGPIRVVDFGCGKGYLTFAVHDWLREVRQVPAEVTGVELRPDMVRLCNAVVERLALRDLHFEQGDLRHWPARAHDVTIALHACDTATDHAIHLGLRCGAQVIVCAPCCHKQIRPQLLAPHPIRPLLQHGVHLGQEAEMVTDALRALVLEASGYDARIVEFVSLEHTSKNKMIVAVRRAKPRPAAEVWSQIDALKSFYGIREHCLERLIRPEPAA